MLPRDALNEELFGESDSSLQRFYKIPEPKEKQYGNLMTH